MALVLAIHHWLSYLLGRRFVVHTDQRSLRQLLAHPLANPAQQNWAAKLLCYDFAIVYKEGKLNRAADALSRRDKEALELSAISIPSWPEWSIVVPLLPRFQGCLPSSISHLQGAIRRLTVREVRAQSVLDTLRSRDEVLELLHHHLRRAQERMRASANKQRRDVEFSVGDMVYLRFRPHRQSSLFTARNRKLAPRFFGPFRVEARIGTTAYRLQLPDSARIHPVFHVSLLKRAIGEAPVEATLPDGLINADPLFLLDKVLARRTELREGEPVEHVLIRCVRLEDDDATWMDEADVYSRRGSRNAVGGSEKIKETGTRGTAFQKGLMPSPQTPTVIMRLAEKNKSMSIVILQTLDKALMEHTFCEMYADSLFHLAARRKVEGLKKIEEVHRDAAQERLAQTSRLGRFNQTGSVYMYVLLLGIPEHFDMAFMELEHCLMTYLMCRTPDNVISTPPTNGTILERIMHKSNMDIARSFGHPGHFAVSVY
ncbi:hypothetical protein SASPL_134776 [Salvia splendens]|uniref:Reverse transcriptase RNase H-like domain-containing protein n=1 Tax=Salvia splendens TaxID=180675 RepID=A0A8X8WYG3_SALSN|nr:hypothetical protein SASPL_134776 [Salvia splendens]